MPPRLSLKARALRQILHEPYVCQSCLVKAARDHQPQRIAPRSLSSAGKPAVLPKARTRSWQAEQGPQLIPTEHIRRNASNGSLASTTAINAPTSVPPPYRELYQTLLALQDTASSYVDLSRLQLATRSLESGSPTIRVALLGLGRNGLAAARKLARVLLSDVLSQEESFEDDIVNDKDGRSLLLRYGDAEESTQSTSLVRTLNVPSRFLQRHNLELLVTALNTDGSLSEAPDRAALAEAMLVPPLTTPNSEGGRVGFVRYPVHKAVVVAEGITGAVEYGHLHAPLLDGNMINGAISVPLQQSGAAVSAEQQTSGNAVDIDLAMHAVTLFRNNNANGAEFNDEWQTSRIPALSEWIAGSQNTAPQPGLHPAVRSLIDSILSGAAASVSVSRDAELTLAAAKTVPESKRTALKAAISSWSADGHRDLQNNLDIAFTTSHSWRRTAWWRLFWRIDDVTISAANVLRNSWLTEAEQRLAFLSGRILDSGLATEGQLMGPIPVLLEPGRQKEMQEYETNQTQPETVAELMQMPSMLSQTQQRSGVNARYSPPWPQSINLSRQYIIHTLVPDLHREAQALLFTTLSIIGGSAALSVWFFAATAGLGIYESVAILALGTVWGVRRLQKKWSRERQNFALAVREDARGVLAEVEGYLRSIVNEGGKASVRPEDVKQWSEASEAIERCASALDKLRKSP